MVRTVLDTLAMISSPRGPWAVDPIMVESFIAERRRGSKRCPKRSCAFANAVDRRSCWRCDAELTKPVRPVSPATVNKNLRTLHHIFVEARKWYSLRSNPFDDVAALPADPREKRPLTADEQRRALDACPTPAWRAYLFLGLTTAVRRGDLAGRRWDDIDLDGRRFKIVEGKTRKARWVRLTVKAVTMLREPRLTHARPEVFVAYGKSGGVVNFYGAVGPMMDRIAEAAGIPRFTFHNTRQTLPTDLAAAGVNQAVVQKVVGHGSIATTTAYYTDVDQKTADAALQRLPLVNGA